MIPMKTRIPMFTSAGFAIVYIAGKVHFAIAGRLGIHGGPAVTAAERAQYADAAQISLAQWANAMVGVLLLIAVLLPLLPATRRWHPLALGIPFALLGMALSALGIFTLAESSLNARGGQIFGIFCVLWGLSVFLLAITLKRTRHPSGDKQRRYEKRGG